MDIQQQLYELSLYAFNKPDSKERKAFFYHLLDHSQWYYHTEKDQVMNQLLSTPFHIQFQQQSLPMAGIGYVASYPEARGKGGIQSLFQQLLFDLKQEQIPFSLLAPFSQVFYRKFGYENVVKQTEIRFDHTALSFLKRPKQRYEYERTTFKKADIHQLQEIYQATLGKQNGTLDRQNWWWQYKQLKYPWHVAFIKKEDRYLGYMFYHMENQTFHIEEIATFSFDGLLALLQFAKGHSSTCQQFIFSAAPKELSFAFTDTQGLTIQTKDYMMGRIVDFAQFQSYLIMPSISSETNLCQIYIQDDSASWNTGTWSYMDQQWVKISEEQLSNVHYTGTIQSWTMFFFGASSLEDLLLTEELQCLCPHPLLQQYEVSSPHLYDYF